MTKDDVMDVVSYILMVLGLCSLIISYQIEEMHGFFMGAVGLLAFILGLKLQILYSIKKARYNTWRDEDLDKLLLVIAEDMHINQSLRRNGFGPKIDEAIKKLLHKKDGDKK